MKINKRNSLIIIATIVLAGIALVTVWRLYQLRGQAVAPTAPKLVPAQEVASCPTVSFPVAGVGCPVNSTCCLQPLTACTNTLQCGSGYICYLEYCVKQTYDPATNTCPAQQAVSPPGGAGGTDGGGDGITGGAGGTAPTPTPTATPRVTPTPVGGATPSPTPRATATPVTTAKPGGSATPTASPSQLAQAGTSTPKPAAETKAGTASPKAILPTAGASWPTILVGAGGVLILILGILLAF